MIYFLNFLLLLIFFEGNDGDITSNDATNFSIEKNPNVSVPLSAYIRLNKNAPASFESIKINLFSASHSKTITYQQDDMQKQGYPLLFVHPDTRYQVTAEVIANNEVVPFYDTIVWHTPALPAGIMDFPVIKAEQLEHTMAKGYTLMNPRRRIPLDQPNANQMNQSFGMLLVVDSAGNVVWYYKTDSRISDFDLLHNGNLSYMTQDSKLIETDWLGNVKNSWYAANRPEGKSDTAIPVDALTFHHDASFLDNGNIVILSSEYREVENYFTSSTRKDADRKKQKVMGDVILEFTPEGKVVWQWHAFEHMDEYRIGYETFSKYWERRGFPGVIDWSHANAISYHSERDAYVINFRYQSALMEIDKRTGNINWILGEPGGWPEDLKDKLISIKNDDTWFWHQHSPSFQGDKLLLFNNNNYQATPFADPVDINNSPSYLLEYKIDRQNRTAEKVWSSKDQEETLVSIAMGDVDYLKNGNILAAYGALLSNEHLDDPGVTWFNRDQVPQWTMIREYQHDSEAKVVWELQLKSRDKAKVGWTIFGAERFEPKY